MSKLLTMTVIFTCILAQLVGAQETKKTESSTATEKKQEQATEQKNQLDAIRKNFALIGKSVKTGDYAAAGKWMTENGRDTLTIDPILTAIMMSNLPAEFQMADGGPDMDDHFDDLQAKMEADREKQKTLLKKYKFDELEIEFDPMSGPSDEVKTKIKTILKKTGKPFEVAKSFRDACSSMMPNLFDSKVKSIDLSPKASRAFITLEMKPEMPENEAQGVMVQIMSPPIVVQFKKDNERWLFNGIDEKRTRETMEEFMNEMGGQFGEFEFGEDTQGRIDY